MSGTKCFSIATKCGVAVIEGCPIFKTQAEEAIVNALKEDGIPPLFLLAAPQGTGKSTLGIRLYHRLIDENIGVLPVVLCGKANLHHELENELTNAISKALYEWMKKHREIDELPSAFGISTLKSLSYVLRAAGLRLFVILDEAHLVVDIGRLAERLREFEPYFKYAGLLLLFQDLTDEEKTRIRDMIIGRGGSRFSWEVLDAKYLLPSGEVLDEVEEWAERELEDGAAARIYRRLAALYGFRAANYFADKFLKPPVVKSPNLPQLHNALVRALAKKYGALVEVSTGRCRADLMKNGVAVDVKLCTGPQSFETEVKKDREKDCNFKYVAVGNCEGDVKLQTDIRSIALGIETVALNMGANVVDVYNLAAEALAELIDLSKIFGAPEVAGPSLEKVAYLVEWLCKEVGQEGKTRSYVKERPYTRQLAAMFGLELKSAEDVSRLVQKLQEIKGLKYRIGLKRSSYVFCTKT